MTNADNLAASLAQIKSPEFADMLDKLTMYNAEYIEYGDKEKPSGSSMSYIRIRLINTPGGEQFAIKTLSFGREGSGAYFSMQDHDGMCTWLIKLISHYHRDTGLSTKIKELQHRHGNVPPPLEFFLIGQNAARMSQLEKGEA